MRKFLATLLALTLVLSLGAVAFAANGPDAGSDNIEEDSGSSAINVQLAAELPTHADAYYVTVEWKSMDFKFSGGAAGTWDHDSHTYNDYSAGTWSGGGQTEQPADTGATSTVTITNHSNVGVTVSGSYAASGSGTYANHFTDGTPYLGVTVDFTDVTNGELKAGNTSNTTPETSSSSPNYNQCSCSVNVKGTPTEPITQSVVGTVTINITKTV